MFENLRKGFKNTFGFGSGPSHTELLIRAALILIVKRIQNMEDRVMGVLQELADKVAEHSTVVASAAAMIDGLQDKLTEALKGGVDEAKVKAIIDSLEADKNKLIEAMKENTVAEGEYIPPAEEFPVEENPAPAEEVFVEEPAPTEEPAPAEEEAPVEYDEWGNPKV